MSDHAGYAAFVRRVLRAMGRRMGDADPEDLVQLLAIREDVDAAITTAVAGLRASGFSWTDIARATGTSRQAAQQRWADRVTMSVNPGLAADRTPIRSL